MHTSLQTGGPLVSSLELPERTNCRNIWRSVCEQFSLDGIGVQVILRVHECEKKLSVVWHGICNRISQESIRRCLILYEFV